jgi:hypothetical protein
VRFTMSHRGRGEVGLDGVARIVSY